MCLCGVRRAEKVLFIYTTTHAHSLLSCVLELILSFSLSSANMGSFPETQNDLTLIITGGRAKNDAGMPVKQGHPT